MKSNCFIYCIAILLVSFTSCSEDFLEKNPMGSLNEGTLKSKEGAELLCIAAYGALHSVNASDWFMTFSSGGCNGWLYSDVRSDIAYKGGGGIADCVDFHAMEVFDVYSTHGHINGKWYYLYCAVQRAASAIKVLKEISSEEWSDRDSRLGEMIFLRAHYFFELQRLFNRIPYFDENTPIGEYVNISNTEYSRDELLEKIAKELELAAELLPETQKDAGRITKYAALALQAKVTLYRAYKQDSDYSVEEIDNKLLEQVVVLCNQIIGHYSLLPDFQQLDLVEYDNGAEDIFSIQFSINDGTQLNRTSWFYALCSPTAAQYAGCGFFQPSQNLVNSYRTDANGLPLFNSFNDKNIQTVLDGLDNNIDPRLDFIIGREGIRWKTYDIAPYNTSWVRDAGTYGKFSSKRHLISPEDPDMWNLGMSRLNWKLIRYADVLLWKAEALIELNKESEALVLINEIRFRAKNSTYVLNWEKNANAGNYLINLYKPGENCIWTQEYAREALRFERKLEFAMEGERFFDLVRWGIASEVMNSYFAKEKTLRPYFNNAAFIHGKDEYLPIPSEQIQYSKGLYEQNPNYITE